MRLERDEESQCYCWISTSDACMVCIELVLTFVKEYAVRD